MAPRQHDAFTPESLEGPSPGPTDTVPIYRAGSYTPASHYTSIDGMLDPGKRDPQHPETSKMYLDLAIFFAVYFASPSDIQYDGESDQN
jgi:hypothetical protein